MQIEIFPEAAVTLLIQQETGIAGETVEEWLYRDIPMTDDSQQFFGGSAMTLEAVTELAGGYDMAWFMAAVIFLFAWLLIYNILFISMQQDIRRFGLLQTLGTTTKQIRRIVLLQVSRCACKGCFVGALAGIFLVVVLMPGVFSNMYLQGLGNASAMIAFRPWILAASVFFGAGVTYLSSLAAMLRLSGMSAVESAKYMEKASVRPFHRAWKIHRSMQTPAADPFWKNAGAPGRNMFIPASMAWGNLFRFRRRACLTIVSLALGLCISLGAVVISRGTDTTNQIEYENYDFEMISNMSVLTAGAYPEMEEIFPESLVQKIAGLKGIEKLQQVKGGFGRIRMDEKAFELRMENIAQGEGWKEEFCGCVVQEVSREYLQELKEFSEEKQLFLDLEPVIEGTGAIMLHYNLFSQAEKENSRDYTGNPFTMYDLFGEKTGEMTFCGYLNFKEKGLPELETTWNGPDIIYFLVSEKGLKRMQIPSQTFLLLLNVKQEKEPLLKNTLTQMLNEHNGQFAAKASHDAYVTDSRTITLQTKSDLLASARNYIASSRMVMFVLCLILLFMGLMNYVNVTAAGLILRQREFAVLESIGMTKGQQKALIPFLLYGKRFGKTTAEWKNFEHTSDIS